MYLPGIDRKSIPIPKSGYPLAAIPVHHCMPSVAVVTRGEFSQSSTGSAVDGVSNASKLSKYLLHDGCGCYRSAMNILAANADLPEIHFWYQQV
jgi:hypothetical protein